MEPVGSIFFKDQYDQQYKVDWTTNNNVIDITTIIMQPYVIGSPPLGYVRSNTIYKKGLITVKRQIIRLIEGGYIIQAEGIESYIDDIQITYPCGGGPIDNFKHHLNNYSQDDCNGIVIDGPHWSDISESGIGCIWDDLNNDGSPAGLTVTGGANILYWVDVWNT
jgi:hypothetical protein